MIIRFLINYVKEKAVILLGDSYISLLKYIYTYQQTSSLTHFYSITFIPHHCKSQGRIAGLKHKHVILIIINIANIISGNLTTAISDYLVNFKIFLLSCLPNIFQNSSYLRPKKYERD